MTNKTVLLVDDSSTARVFHRSTITHKTGYRVETAGDGEEAVRKAIHEVPDLILMDVMMPKMNGLDACRLLKKNERTKHIPIILLTFKTGQEFAQEGFESGCNEYLTKPLDVAELLKVFEKHLGWNAPVSRYATGRP